MSSSKELIETAAKTQPSPSLPSTAAAELSKRIARDSLDPKHGLTLPAKMTKAAAARS